MSNLAKTLKAKKEARAAALGLVKTFSAAVEAGTFKEDTDGPALEAAQRSLEAADADVERVQNLINIQSRAAGWNGDGGDEQTDETRTVGPTVISKRSKDAEAAANFSIIKFTRDAVKGKMSGLERELSDEGEKECRDANLDAQAGFFIPGFIARGSQKRDLLVGTTTAGGHTVATDMGELISFLKSTLFS